MVEYKNIILKDTERALPYKSKSGGDNRKNHPIRGINMTMQVVFLIVSRVVLILINLKKHQRSDISQVYT